MSILGYNGGCAIAMMGTDCIAIASDLRFGIQGQTIDNAFGKVFEMDPHIFLGLVGLQSDIITVKDRILFRKNVYEVRENRKITPATFSSMISSFLYEHRFGPFFVEPVIAGLHPKTFEPFICNMDLLGCLNTPKDFVVSGTCTEQLYGMCETLWRPDLDKEELFETISQALINAFDRDATTGWGAKVYLIEKNEKTVRTIQTRMD